jgi:transposase
MAINWEDVAKAHGYKDEKEMFADLYVAQDLSIEDLTKKLKISRNAIRNVFVKLELPTKKRGGANNQKFKITDELIERVKEKGVKAVAKELNVSYTALYKRLYQIVPKKDTIEAVDTTSVPIEPT